MRLLLSPFILFMYFFGHTQGMWKVLGQELNPNCSGDTEPYEPLSHHGSVIPILNRALEKL